MRKLILIATCAALAACSQTEAPAEGEAADTATTAEAAPAAAEETMAGTYDVTAKDGSVTTTTIDAENNFVVTADGKEVARGTVAMTKDQTCFNSAEEAAAPECWTDGEPAADGSWVANSDEGETVTVKKRAEAATTG